MQRNTGDTQTLTVEYGFLDSTKDDPNQLKNNYKNLAEAVLRAVTEYIGATYVPIEGTNTYVVQKGDTLYSIARKYNIPVNDIKTLNNLTSNTLSIGQILKIPTINNIDDNISSNNTYIVKKGDTLYSIAKKYNLTVDKLKSLNNLSNNLVSIGQVLVVDEVEAPSLNYNEYIVGKGDTLYSIARKFGISVNELIQYNNLNSTVLSVGQVLKIPGEEKITYVVKAGDTLYGIARKYNTTVENIKSKNNLSNNVLSIGQILTI
nr:LysM peptidoglycan-binding domain-containing protein [Bacilli bacterium]